MSAKIEDLKADLGIGELNEEFITPGAEIPVKGKKKADADKKAPAAAVSKPPAEEQKAAPKSKQKIRIIIDEVKGMSNYEVVGVNGVVHQIKRGVPVEVDPAVVHVLENAKTTHIEQKVNKITGEVEDKEHTFSAIPWRRA